MQRKFSTFAKKAKLKREIEHRDRVAYFYVAPKDHIIMFNNDMVHVIYIFPAFQALNPMGGVDQEATEDSMEIVCVNGERSTEIEGNSDFVANWELFKKVL